MQSLAEAEVSDVADIVRPCGLGKPARDIVAMCQMLLTQWRVTRRRNYSNCRGRRKTANLWATFETGGGLCTHCIRITV